MNNITLLGATLILTISLPAFADTSASGDESSRHQEAMEKCQKKAKKHDVSQDKMQSYVNECVDRHMKKDHDDDSKHKHSTDDE